MTLIPDGCEAEHATLRFDPDRIRESFDGISVVARVDVLGADLPAAGRRNIYARHHEAPAPRGTTARQAVPNQRRFAIQLASYDG
jgi:hypothetical protein